MGIRLLEAGRSKWLFCLGISFCAIILTVWPNALIDLRYDRAALESGQWWRVMTSHFAHLTTQHLLLNLFGLFLVCELLWHDFSWRHGCALLFFTALGISGLLWFLHPELTWYAGFSGLLHGLWAGCALAGWWPMQAFDRSAAASNGVVQMRLVRSRYFVIGALILLALKLSLETVYGPSLHTERAIGGMVIVTAHVYGALIGIVYVLIWRAISGPRLGK